MSEKRYYWLKLPKDFFKRHDISFIKSLPNGPEIALFYLELMAESVDHDGELRFSEDIPYTDKMLASVTDTPLEIVEKSMSTLQEFGLIKIDDEGTIIIPKVLKMIGSASDTDEARRQRRCRERKKAERDKMSHENVTSVTDSVTKDNESKSKSKSKSKSIEKEYTEKDEPARVRFVAPTHDEILDYMTSYCFEKQYDLNPVLESEKFFNYYTSNNWRVGRNKMKDYKAAARSWLLRAKDYVKPSPANNPFEDLVEGNF